MSTLLAQAQTLALTKLVIALDATDDPAEVRRLAQAILAINPERLAAVAAVRTTAATTPTSTSTPAASRPPTPTAPTRPTTTSTPPPPSPRTPLTTEELAALRALLPHVNPDRFNRKHNPTHWRTVLANHAHAPPSHPTSRAA